MLLQLRPGAKPQFLASSHVASRPESQSTPRSARVQGAELLPSSPRFRLHFRKYLRKVSGRQCSQDVGRRDRQGAAETVGEFFTDFLNFRTGYLCECGSVGSVRWEVSRQLAIGGRVALGVQAVRARWCSVQRAAPASRYDATRRHFRRSDCGTATLSLTQ